MPLHASSAWDSDHAPKLLRMGSSKLPGTVRENKGKLVSCSLLNMPGGESSVPVNLCVNTLVVRLGLVQLLPFSNVPFITLPSLDVYSPPVIKILPAAAVLSLRRVVRPSRLAHLRLRRESTVTLIQQLQI